MQIFSFVAMLETKEFQIEHTGVQIASELRDILQNWDLSEDNLIAATTNNGSNIVCALEQLGWNNIKCFAHTAQNRLTAISNTILNFFVLRLFYFYIVVNNILS